MLVEKVMLLPPVSDHVMPPSGRKPVTVPIHLTVGPEADLSETQTTVVTDALLAALSESTPKEA